MDSSFSLVVASRLCSDWVASATYIWWSCNSHAFSRGAEFPWHMKECPWSMPDCQIDNYGLPCLIVISFSVIVDNKTNLNLDLAIEWKSGNTGSVWESAKDHSTGHVIIIASSYTVVDYKEIVMIIWSPFHQLVVEIPVGSWGRWSWCFSYITHIKCKLGCRLMHR